MGHIRNSVESNMCSIVCANDLDTSTNVNIKTKDVTAETKKGELAITTFVVNKEDKQTDGEIFGDATQPEMDSEPGPDPYRMHYGVDDVPAIHLTVLFGLQVKLVVVSIFCTTQTYYVLFV